MKSNKNLNAIFASMILATTLAFIFFLQKSDSNKYNTELAKLMPEFVVLNGISSEFNESGQLAYKMSAKQLSHYLHNDFSELTQPEVKLRDNENTLWIITAEAGVFKGKSSLLELSRSVRIKPEAQGSDGLQNEMNGSSSSDLFISTEHLIVDTRMSRIRTDESIIVKSDGDTLKSIGLSADLNTNQVKLHSKVTGLHTPKS